MLSQEALEKILGIKESVPIRAEDMADRMNVTFYPFESEKVSQNVLSFRKQLEATFLDLKVNIVPFEKAFEKVSLGKVFKRLFRIIGNNFVFILNIFFRKKETRHFIPISALLNLVRRKKIKRGISVIALGHNKTWNLPIDHTASFTDSFVVTIVDWPRDIEKNSDFEKHFNLSMNLFAEHMSNIIIATDEKKWLLYNFNASHPIYSRNEGFKEAVLHALVPKIVAPIRPSKFSEFKILKDSFDIYDDKHQSAISDLQKGALRFEKTQLYPPGKKIADLPFRNDFYKWIGSIHLDERSGMSFGFFARQMPSKLEELVPKENFEKKTGAKFSGDKDFLFFNDDLFILLNISGQGFCLKVPEVWVLTLRSGCHKTRFVPEKDLLKLGIKSGQMFLETPKGLVLNPDYKPSFDTKVILAHAIGNAIIASILKHFKNDDPFVEMVEKRGLALAHWHGYFHPEKNPTGLSVHGLENPHVSCSSPQSAIYAISGKLNVFYNQFLSQKNFVGDIHIEPHHGTNIVFESLEKLALFLEKNPNASVLGNKYLEMYYN